VRCSPLLVLAACSAAPVPRDLERAESLERAGRYQEAILSYREAQRACRPKFCGDAYRGEAQLLEDSGRLEEAAAAWERIPTKLPDEADTCAAAMKNAGMVRLALHQDERAYDLFWRTIAAYPEEAASDDALRLVVADGRRRNPQELVEALARLGTGLSGTGIADNLLWETALVYHEDLHDDARATATIDRLIEAYPTSPTLDDALVLDARLARAMRDPDKALARLRRFIATREPSNRLGSYIPPLMPKAQMDIGLILRDDLGRPAEAIGELRKVEKHFPESKFVDDCLYEIAVAYARLRDDAGVCRTLAELSRRFPESKYGLERGPALAKEHGCAR